MSDYIDRDAAIRATDGELTITGEENMAAVAEYITGVVEKLKGLPGQPEIIRCRECKHCYVDGENVRFNVCELNHNKVQSDDWFCADAERRVE